MRKDILDWSTINRDILTGRPRVTLTGGDRLQDDCGNGCAGDPPGFPSYFTRAVYSASGNEPCGKWNYVMLLDGILYGIELKKWQGAWEEQKKRREALFRELWKPLPLDHPRTVAWIQSTFLHHQHCYHTEGWDGKDWHDDKHFLIWPGGCLGETPFGRLRKLDFEIQYAKEHKSFDKWRSEEQDKFKAEIQAEIQRISEYCRAQAIPERHNATVIVRRHYPEFQPTADLIEPSFPHPGNWWSVAAVKPTPGNCPGEYGRKHPCNGSWCQWCGWVDPEKNKAAK